MQKIYIFGFFKNRFFLFSHWCQGSLKASVGHGNWGTLFFMHPAQEPQFLVEKAASWCFAIHSRLSIAEAAEQGCWLWRANPGARGRAQAPLTSSLQRHHSVTGFTFICLSTPTLSADPWLPSPGKGAECFKDTVSSCHFLAVLGFKCNSKTWAKGSGCCLAWREEMIITLSEKDRKMTPGSHVTLNSVGAWTWELLPFSHTQFAVSLLSVYQNLHIAFTPVSTVMSSTGQSVLQNKTNSWSSWPQDKVTAKNFFKVFRGENSPK